MEGQHTSLDHTHSHQAQALWEWRVFQMREDGTQIDNVHNNQKDTRAREGMAPESQFNQSWSECNFQNHQPQCQPCHGGWCVHIQGGVWCCRHCTLLSRSEPGKWGRAIWKLDAKWMAWLQGGKMGVYVLVHNQVGHEDSISEPADYSAQLHVPNVHNMDMEYMVVDLYAVCPESHDTQGKEVKPFIHQVKLQGLDDKMVGVWGLFDNSTMVDVMLTKKYLQLQHKLAPLVRSIRCLQMASGSIMNPVGCWKGKVELGRTTVTGLFEVFDSSRGWDFLFGKRLMTVFSAVHDYATDEVFLPTNKQMLWNQTCSYHLHDVFSTVAVRHLWLATVNEMK